MQNVHRYFMYLAVIFVFILIYDAWKALWFLDPSTGQEKLGLGVGTLILAMNATFLGGYTFGCHSFRHLIGGFMDQMSKAPIRAKAYNCVTCLNKRHMNWAWLSLFWVAFSDIYVRLCAMGIITDIRFF